jgi:hypothetical protein
VRDGSRDGGSDATVSVFGRADGGDPARGGSGFGCGGVEASRGERADDVWRKRFGTIAVSDVRRLKGLEAENARLKKLVAERDLEIEVMKEIAAKNW